MELTIGAVVIGLLLLGIFLLGRGGSSDKANRIEDDTEGSTDAELRNELTESGSETSDDDAAQPAEVVDSRESERAAVRRGLKNTRGGFIARLSKIFGAGSDLSPEVFDEIEEVLITADIGVHTADGILESLKKERKKDRSDPDAMWSAIRAHAKEIFQRAPKPEAPTNPLHVVLVVGVNGVGKTTTIGKLANRAHQDGQSVMLVAGDTFRAAAVKQLQIWGERVGCEVVHGKDGADPSSVVFDGVKSAIDAGVDRLFIDTAGRLHTKGPLMEEMRKIGRTVEKALGRPADEVMLVLDATTGQNAIQQAALFKEIVPLTGLALTKLDGTAKGGVILGIVDQHRVPVQYIGVGEGIDDLRTFDADIFVDALFERPDEA